MNGRVREHLHDALLNATAYLRILDNGLRHLMLTDSTRRNQALLTFKDADSGVDILLVPMSFGSRGLNVTEANHVIFCEPIMDLAAEQQAVGRVHRIGQSRQTVVHRFSVRGSVEERIVQMFPHTAVHAPDGGDDDQQQMRDDVMDVDSPDYMDITLGQLHELF